MSAAVPSAAEPEVVVLLDSDDEQQGNEPAAAQARGPGSRAPGPPQLRRAGHPRRPLQQQQQQQQQAQQSRRAREESECIDLTDEPDSPRVQVVSSTVQPVVKRQRKGTPAKPTLTQTLIQQARAPQPPPPPPPEPKGIKCGICLESMGSSSNRAMASGPCGHVYCRDCLVEAVKAQKKCPSCRRSLQVRQLHQVFVEFQ